MDFNFIWLQEFRKNCWGLLVVVCVSGSKFGDTLLWRNFWSVFSAKNTQASINLAPTLSGQRCNYAACINKLIMPMSLSVTHFDGSGRRGLAAASCYFWSENYRMCLRMRKPPALLLLFYLVKSFKRLMNWTSILPPSMY